MSTNALRKQSYIEDTLKVLFMTMTVSTKSFIFCDMVELFCNSGNRDCRVHNTQAPCLSSMYLSFALQYIQL